MQEAQAMDMLIVQTAMRKYLHAPAKRRKKHDVAEFTLLQSLLKSTTDEKDEDALYCRSIILIMRDLPKIQKRFAKSDVISKKAVVTPQNSE